MPDDGLCPRLRDLHVDLADNELTATACAALGARLVGRRLRALSLDLGHNAIGRGRCGPRGAFEPLLCRPECERLELVLRHNPMTVDDGRALCAALRRLPRCAVLAVDLRRTTVGTVSLAQLTRGSPILRRLWWAPADGRVVGGGGPPPRALGLCADRVGPWRSLGFGGAVPEVIEWFAGDGGGDALCQTWPPRRCPPTDLRVTLTHSGLTWRGCAALARHLVSHPRVTALHLDLSDNPDVGDLGGALVLRAIAPPRWAADRSTRPRG